MLKLKSSLLGLLMFMSAPVFVSSQDVQTEFCFECFTPDHKRCFELIFLDLSKCAGQFIAQPAGDLSTQFFTPRVCNKIVHDSGWQTWECPLEREESWVVLDTVNRVRLATIGESGRDCFTQTGSKPCKVLYNCGCRRYVDFGNGPPVESDEKYCYKKDWVGLGGEVWEHFISGDECGGTSSTPDPVGDQDATGG